MIIYVINEHKRTQPFTADASADRSPGTGPFFGWKSHLAEKRLAENMDLSPSHLELPMAKPLTAGAAAVDVTPLDRQFLFGYPHIPRYSTGVHDPLLSSALFLSDGVTPLILVGNDVIYISRETTGRVRDRIERETGVPAANILVAATHTHSGPLTGDMISNDADAVVPKTDPRYVEQLEDGMVLAAVKAFCDARPAEIGLVTADGSCVGTHRHDPAGPSNPEVPVLAVRDRDSHAFLSAMLVCSMHPTVLHEDSTLISGDFPGMTRQYLQQHV
jgi:neutral ceramidase